MKNMSTLKKAATHKVEATTEGFLVTSGTSGAVYLVEPLAFGGATCNCAFSKHSAALSSRCSHVLAAERFAVDEALIVDAYSEQDEEENRG